MAQSDGLDAPSGRCRVATATESADTGGHRRRAILEGIP